MNNLSTTTYKDISNLFEATINLYSIVPFAIIGLVLRSMVTLHDTFDMGMRVMLSQCVS